MITVKAFRLHGDSTLRDATDGHQLPKAWEGYCMVHFEDSSTMVFETGIDKPTGERYWNAKYPIDWKFG
jgi:hypothetical protein